MLLMGWRGERKASSPPNLLSCELLGSCGRHTFAATHRSYASFVTSVLSSQKAARVTSCAGCSSSCPPRSAPIVKGPAGTRIMSSVLALGLPTIPASLPVLVPVLVLAEGAAQFSPAAPCAALPAVPGAALPAALAALPDAPGATATAAPPDVASPGPLLGVHAPSKIAADK